MGEFLEKYGGVIVAVIAIAALIAVVGIIFTGDDQTGIGGAIKAKIDELKTLGSTTATT